jgi:hypothetical protein
MARRRRIIQVIFDAHMTPVDSGYLQMLATAGLLTELDDGCTFTVEIFREARFETLKGALDFWEQRKWARWKELDAPQP